MTDRIRLDELTSDQLDALYDERDRLRAAVPPDIKGSTAADTALRHCTLCGTVLTAGHECDVARLKARVVEARTALAQARATLDEVLRHFVHKGHPGVPCLSSGWINETTVARWRATLQPPKEN